MNKMLEYAAFAAEMYLASLLTAVTASGMFSRNFRSQEELEDATYKEKNKLAITETVKSYFGDGHAKKLEDGTYVIYADTLAVVRHELYHIKKGHVELHPKLHGINQILFYLFVEEPQAIAYEFGIKL